MFMPTFATSILLLLASTEGITAAPLSKRQTNTGDGTFFGPGLGACGTTNSASDLMVAVSSQVFESFGPESNGNPVCGKQITATANGKSVTVTVEDKCPGCAAFDLDFSPAAFNQLADPSVGRIHNVNWSFA